MSSGNLRGRLDRLEKDLGMAPQPEPTSLSIVTLGPPMRGRSGRTFRLGSDGRQYGAAFGHTTEVRWWGGVITGATGPGYSYEDL